MSKFIFFTFNDFSKDGGGTIRMYGILNSLAKLNEEVILISNANNNLSNFDKNIKYIFFNKKISKRQKRFFQLCIAIFPNFINKLIFRSLLVNFKNQVPSHYRENIIFFEYLDNSFGYFLWKNKLIKHYINDTHGIATIEFKYKFNANIKQQIINYVKYFIAFIHDNKILKNVKQLIVVSEEMKKFYIKKYNMDSSKICVLKDGVDKIMCKNEVDQVLLEKLVKKYTTNNEKIILFAGSFKDLGGVDDLVKAFNIVNKKIENVYLILIGDGEKFPVVKQLIKEFNLTKKVFLLGRVPYNKLRTYQELADIIVCPDKKHPYSDLVPHIKYYDSLVSGKIVINGKFEVIKSINKNKELSLLFEPSNVKDLADKILFALKNENELKNKFKNVSKYVCQNFNYFKFVNDFINNCKTRIM